MQRQSDMVFAMVPALLVSAMLQIQEVRSQSQTSSPPSSPGSVTLPGLWGLSYCQGPHACLSDEGCVQLQPMCRAAQANCQRSRRPSPKICVPIGTSLNVSEMNACESLCPIGCERECRQPVVTSCLPGERCVVRSVIGRCVVGKGSSASCDQQRTQPTGRQPMPRLEPDINLLQGPDCPRCFSLDPVSACRHGYHFLLRGKVLRRTAESYTVRVKSFAFNPLNVTLPANMTVTLRRKQLNSAHTVPTSCACPVMNEGAQYLMAGFVKNGRMSLRRRPSAAIIYTNTDQSKAYRDLLAGLMRRCRGNNGSDVIPRASAASTGRGLGELEERDDGGNTIAGDGGGGDDLGTQLWRQLAQQMFGGDDYMRTPSHHEPTAVLSVRPTVSTVGRWERSARDAPVRVFHASVRHDDVVAAELWRSGVRLPK